jgi:Fe-S-cluster-containing dehydrogenase component
VAINRRDFFKLAAAGTTTLAVGSAAADDIPPTDCSEYYGVLVDTVVCIGCRKCELACDQEHTKSGRRPESFDDKSVFDRHRRPDKDAFTVLNRFEDPDNPSKKYTMKVQCMHCNEPACVSACIVGALRKTSTGPVVYDAWKCIGCRYCMVACPFQIPAYEYDNALDPRVRKCTFCFERITEDHELPACVAICPNEALTFGTRQQLLDIAHYRIKSNPGVYVDHVYGETEAGGTSWLYLAPVDFKHTELPVLKADVIPSLTETIQHGIFKSFLPPIALYGLLGLVMHATRERDAAPSDAEVPHE